MSASLGNGLYADSGGNWRRRADAPASSSIGYVYQGLAGPVLRIPPTGIPPTLDTGECPLGLTFWHEWFPQGVTASQCCTTTRPRRRKRHCERWYGYAALFHTSGVRPASKAPLRTGTP